MNTTLRLLLCNIVQTARLKVENITTNVCD